MENILEEKAEPRVAKSFKFAASIFTLAPQYTSAVIPPFVLGSKVARAGEFKPGISPKRKMLPTISAPVFPAERPS
jgi:hypothetical protein